MKLLQSIRNDFPQFYKEYSVEDLKIDSFTERNRTLIWKQNGRPGKWLSPKELSHLKYLHKDIKTRGLIHPIIVWSEGKILNVFIGTEQVWFARRECYTHISAYHVTTAQEWESIRPKYKSIPRNLRSRQSWGPTFHQQNKKT
tara:strand:+ start:71 stop:499 length:429 start_codon:yes stop_codon:yes gene_type:complete